MLTTTFYNRSSFIELLMDSTGNWLKLASCCWRTDVFDSAHPLRPSMVVDRQILHYLAYQLSG